MRASVVASFLALAALSLPGSARAEQSIIKNPGDHPSYRFEAEPHGLIGYGGPFLRGRNELGVGFRGSIVLLDNGFIPSINNSIALGFGLDAFFRSGTVFIPIVMQWNFWLSTHWSVFGEPGIGIAPNEDGNRDTIHFTGYAGGRFHFNDRVALTLRLGYPSISVGASFLF
ncbi:MAG: hypothetical protein JWP97_5787 [Labilithrix sp.]|nr:hypothetical protein [Labilithrix sp.]